MGKPILKPMVAVAISEYDFKNHCVTHLVKDQEKIDKIVEFVKNLGGINQIVVVEDAAEAKTIVSLKINYKKEIANE